MAHPNLHGTPLSLVPNERSSSYSSLQPHLLDLRYVGLGAVPLGAFSRGYFSGFNPAILDQPVVLFGMEQSLRPTCHIHFHGYDVHHKQLWVRNQTTRLPVSTRELLEMVAREFDTAIRRTEFQRCREPACTILGGVTADNFLLVGLRQIGKSHNQTSESRAFAKLYTHRYSVPLYDVN
ncbi:hypothetical protein B0H21DRAFT_710399 [Amylocystis lapponica]|nr:hypothetical protein B0H21DRAFT_710399 [Amylocystis lapponica]